MVVWWCCCYWRADSETSVLNEEVLRKGRVFGGFPNFCCPERWYGMNRISHPDWVKLRVDPNSRIKLRAKQKYEILSATSICPKVNVIARRKFVLNYNESGVHRFNHYTTMTPPEKHENMCFRCTPFRLRHCWIQRVKLLITRATHTTFLLCYLGFRWWRTRFPTIFTSAMSFTVLDLLENLTTVWKMSINWTSFYIWNNVERYSFIICLHSKDMLHQ